jgi:hypothetical protein
MVVIMTGQPKREIGTRAEFLHAASCRGLCKFLHVTGRDGTRRAMSAAILELISIVNPGKIDMPAGECGIVQK